MDRNCDVVFIGGGPAGYTGAIRSSELGFKTLLIEKNKIGGVCLHLGCIPTKAMLASASLVDRIRRAAQFGLEVRLDSPYKLWKISEKKDEIVEVLAGGLSQTLKKKGVNILHGTARFKKPHLLAVESANGKDEIEAGTIVIATGARPQELSGVPFNGTGILSSDHILSLRDVPKSLGIVGGGVIGCEFASLFADLGSEVAMVEMMPQILPQEDGDIAKRLEVLFRRRKIQIYSDTELEKLSTDGHLLSCVLTGGKKFSCEKILVAVGRKGNIEDLGLDSAGIRVEKGVIVVNEFLETSARGVFAAGDVIGSPQLAHVAEAEALCVVENLKRTPRPMDYRGWPNAIFTHPEVASTGLTREKAEKEGRKIEEVRTLYGALGKSHVERETDGLIKLVFDRESQEILGGHIIGERASDLIAEISLAIRLHAKREDLAGTIHAHPTFSEIIWEASRTGQSQ